MRCWSAQIPEMLGFGVSGVHDAHIVQLPGALLALVVGGVLRLAGHLPLQGLQLRLQPPLRQLPRLPLGFRSLLCL